MTTGGTLLRVAIVGCGTLARTIYLRTLPRVPGIRVALLSDADLSAAADLAARFGAEAASLERVASEADAVLIATPPSSHASLIRTLLRRGRVVFCEKPFVPSASEARALVDEADAAGARLLVGHFRRTFAGSRLARDLITSGSLGRVLAIQVAEGGRFNWETRSSYETTDPSGGVLFDTGSHSIDLALFAAGLDEGQLEVGVRWVQRDREEPSHELRALLDLRTASGPVSMSVALSRREALANRVRVSLEHGTVDIPVGMRPAIRLGGPGGACVLRAAAQPAETMDAFMMQWRAVLGGADEGLTFEARRFVGLTAVLQALGESRS